MKDVTAREASSSFRWPVVNSGPSWSAPPVRMPDIFSVQPDFQLDSWFYAGCAVDTAGQEYSLNVYFGRGAPSSASPPAQWGVTLGVGIGVAADDVFHMSSHQGIGLSTDAANPATLTIPPATDFAYSLAFDDSTGTASVSYVGSGPNDPAVGIAGARYQLNFQGTDAAGARMSLALDLRDDLGTRMEGYSGYVGEAKQGDPGLYTYEIAQPQLTITGGTITAGETDVTLVSGNLWNDRQTYTYPPGGAPAPGGALYRGCWIPLLFDNGVSAGISAGWPQAQQAGTQWMSGRDVGVAPTSGTGNLYFPEGMDRYNGGALLQTAIDDWDYDINIFNPLDPPNSPHWLSPDSGYTYCTKWRIHFSERLVRWGIPSEVFLLAMVEGCEYYGFGQRAISEGAVWMYSDEACTQLIGRGFVEQMGYN